MNIFSQAIILIATAAMFLNPAATQAQEVSHMYYDAILRHAEIMHMEAQENLQPIPSYDMILGESCLCGEMAIVVDPENDEVFVVMVPEKATNKYLQVEYTGENSLDIEAAYDEWTLEFNHMPMHWLINNRILVADILPHFAKALNTERPDLYIQGVRDSGVSFETFMSEYVAFSMNPPMNVDYYPDQNEDETEPDLLAEIELASGD